MPFVTTLVLQSGDRETLDGLVADLKQEAAKKGIELKGPHTNPPTTIRVPLYRHLSWPEAEFPPWEYTVYERVVRLAGHDSSVRRITDRLFPRSVHVRVEVEQVRSVGSAR